MAEESHPELIYDWNRVANAPPPRGAVTLDDETLRDGLQNPSVRNPTIAQKRELVRLMDRLGIHTVNVGLPGAGDRHFDDCLDLARLIADEGLRISANCACRTLVSDVEPVRRIMDATDSDVLAMCFIGSSPIRQFTEGWTLDTILGHIDKSLGWAKEHEVPFALVTEDTTRSRPQDIERLYRHAIDLGAERLVVCDTCGHATPEGTFELVRFVRRLADEAPHEVRVDWHGHRDRALSVANCLAAVRAGADQIHGAALGIGERAGNAPMDLLIVNLHLLGWIDGDFTALAEYCARASEYLDVEIPANYPVFGHDAFLTGTGVHAAAVIKALAKGDSELADRVYSGVPASDYGRCQRIGVGPMSGRSNVQFWLGQFGYDAEDDELVAHVFEAAKQSDHLFADDELKALVDAFVAARGRA